MNVKRALLIFSGLTGLGVVVIWLVSSGPTPVSPGADVAVYTGSADCRDCHESFYEKWSNSWHGLAMRPYTPAFARAKLVPQTNAIPVGDHYYRADIEADPAVVRESGPEGEKTYPMAYVLGGKNVNYFLTPWQGGRLQVLPVAFDVRQQGWYDTTASMVRHFREATDQALDWTERPLTFNLSCYNCHVSQLSKSYDLATDTYTATWGEPGINCEVCHGPGGKHIQAMLALGDRKPKANQLQIIVTRNFSHEQINGMCAPCHAKMMPLTTNFMPGDRFFDHFNLTTLEDRDFYPDGRDLGENFTCTLWLISPCVVSGQLDCMHCHTSSGRNKYAGPGAEADRACLPCHERLVAEPAAHSHHPAESEGSRCVACHMPRTSFARMRRHDHTLLPPTPAATIQFQSPNACNLCHEDQTPQWSDEWVRKWYPRDYQAPVLRRAHLIAAARQQDWAQLSEMMAYVTETNRNEIYAASLLRLLQSCPNTAKWPVFYEALLDPSPLVRACAAAGLADGPDGKATRALVSAAGDPYGVVRTRAAFALARRAVNPSEGPDRATLEKAFAELEASMRCQPDVALSHYNLGLYYQTRGDPAAAVAEYDLARKMYPSFLPVHVNLSLIQAAQGRVAEAERTLRVAQGINPTNAAVNFNLGLLLAEEHHLTEAETCFRVALKTDPGFAAAAYNLGVLMAGRNMQETLALCGRAAELMPQEPKYAYTFAFYLRESGNLGAAEETLRELLKRHPQYDTAIALLGSIYEETGRIDLALELYRRAALDEKLPQQVRLHFTMKIAAMEQAP